MIGGAVLSIMFMNPVDGFPKSVTAATWLATESGTGPVIPAGRA